MAGGLERVSHDVAAVAVEGLTGEGTAAAVAGMMHGVWDAVDAALHETDLPAVACGPGCRHCCRVNVSVLAPEAIAIAAYLAETPEELPVVAAALTYFAERVRWLDHQERLRKELYCPFLDAAGSCTVHPVRPLMCRSVTSTDPEACMRSLDAAAWDEEEPVQMDLYRKFAAEEAYRALAAVLEAEDYDARPVELVQGVAAVLQRPQVVADFLERKQVEWG